MTQAAVRRADTTGTSQSRQTYSIGFIVSSQALEYYLLSSAISNLVRPTVSNIRSRIIS